MRSIDTIGSRIHKEYIPSEIHSNNSNIKITDHLKDIYHKKEKKNKKRNLSQSGHGWIFSKKQIKPRFKNSLTPVKGGYSIEAISSNITPLRTTPTFNRCLGFKKNEKSKQNQNNELAVKNRKKIEKRNYQKGKIHQLSPQNRNRGNFFLYIENLKGNVRNSADGFYSNNSELIPIQVVQKSEAIFNQKVLERLKSKKRSSSAESCFKRKRAQNKTRNLKRTNRLSAGSDIFTDKKKNFSNIRKQSQDRINKNKLASKRGKDTKSPKSTSELRNQHKKKPKTQNKYKTFSNLNKSFNSSSKPRVNRSNNMRSPEYRRKNINNIRPKCPSPHTFENWITSHYSFRRGKNEMVGGLKKEEAVRKALFNKEFLSQNSYTIIKPSKTYKKPNKSRENSKIKSGADRAKSKDRNHGLKKTSGLTTYSQLRKINLAISTHIRKNREVGTEYNIWRNSSTNSITEDILHSFSDYNSSTLDKASLKNLNKPNNQFKRRTNEEYWMKNYKSPLKRKFKGSKRFHDLFTNKEKSHDEFNSTNRLKPKLLR